MAKKKSKAKKKKAETTEKAMEKTTLTVGNVKDNLQIFLQAGGTKRILCLVSNMKDPTHLHYNCTTPRKIDLGAHGTLEIPVLHKKTRDEKRQSDGTLKPEDYTKSDLLVALLKNSVSYPDPVAYVLGDAYEGDHGEVLKLWYEAIVNRGLENDAKTAEAFFLEITEKKADNFPDDLHTLIGHDAEAVLIALEAMEARVNINSAQTKKMIIEIGKLSRAAHQGITTAVKRMEDNTDALVRNEQVLTAMLDEVQHDFATPFRRVRMQMYLIIVANVATILLLIAALAKSLAG